MRREINQHQKTVESLLKIEGEAQETIDAIVQCLRAGGKILICGNGGSAADSQHMAAELIGRFKRDREALPAIALTTDTSILTALGNDWGVETLFSRQIQALGSEGDILIAFSTSGSSPNILEACKSAREKKMRVIGFTGNRGEKLKTAADICLTVDSEDTPNIQEAHITLAHIICGKVEEKLFP
ncbi:MAG: SIS domain-containing protein [Candidatus Altiarchaeales archaeon]|nr:SIS domain-containing protein [Candidatus Altiarchaeales archaeon]